MWRKVFVLIPWFLIRTITIFPPEGNKGLAVNKLLQIIHVFAICFNA